MDRRVWFGIIVFAMGAVGVIVLRQPRPVTSVIVWQGEQSSPDREPEMRVLEASVDADPVGAGAIRGLAMVYATVLYEGGPQTERVKAALEASRNVWVLSNTAYSLQSLYNQGIQRGETKPEVVTLAERYFERAKAMDPNMDRAKILPQIDLAEIARRRAAEERAARDWEARATAAVKTLRRLPVDAFPQLPVAVARVLRERACLVPQAPRDRFPNVVQGEFVERGRKSWAVLCSADGVTALLVFRDDEDTQPIVLSTSEDKRNVQEDAGVFVYGRAIAVADEDYIRSHAQPGEAKPMVLDHVGVEDIILEKASSIWYFERGQWLQLPGAD